VLDGEFGGVLEEGGALEGLEDNAGGLVREGTEAEIFWTEEN